MHKSIRRLHVADRDRQHQVPGRRLLARAQRRRVALHFVDQAGLPATIDGGSITARR